MLVIYTYLFIYFILIYLSTNKILINILLVLKLPLGIEPRSKGSKPFMITITLWKQR